MKNFFRMTVFGALFAGGAALLGGCPIYPDNASYRVCTDNGCYNCPDNYYSDACSGWQCNSTADCPNGYTCDPGSGYCTNGGPTPADGGNPGSCSQPSDCPSGENCGADNQCHAGDCSNSGCPSGYVCKLSGGTLQCVNPVGRDSGSGDGSSADSGGHDGGDSGFSGCHSDSECSSLGAGAKCLDGACVSAPNQCFDGTQCPSGDQCVAGVCTPTCDGTHACPTGYSCQSTSDGGASGVCSGNPSPCGSGQACTGSNVCVEQHCVPPCGVGNTCPTGEVCVAGGCIPDQKPQFVCGADGTLGDGMPGNCAVGSICLHHSCYIGCTPDAGTTGCRAADQFNQCKTVTLGSGSYNVCGSSTNLGSDCDPTQGKQCTSPGAVCIDGYCH